jgi:hypothetical protein
VKREVAQADATVIVEGAYDATAAILPTGTTMKPPECPACHGRFLTHGSLADLYGLFFKFSAWKWVPVRARVCLDCGAVTPYLDEAALTKMRAWNGYRMKEKEAVDEL